ncbi:C3 and PZP-like alpha-2-macroglobulin domain-containing protein 8 [Mytilus trossulus]|uniref:C3 and PZP-like alpha-2-macroglobulin domain-containing protein 8 n=1 Tax=Mytilus trossulus TaxID=6551 RepID=UPI00300777B9
MEIQVKSNGYEVPDTRKSVPHIYSALNEHSSGIYTYIEPKVNIKSKRKWKKKLRLCVILFVGIIVGTVLTIAGFFIFGPSSTPSLRGNHYDNFESPSGNKTFTTPEKYEFRMVRCEIGDIPFKQQFLSFRVKSCSDVYLVLTSEYDDEGPLIEIAIGLNGNTRSAIRTEKRGTNIVTFTRSFLNCRRFTSFWVSWGNQIIQVGMGLQENNREFMMMMDDRKLKIVNIGISTGRGTTGKWLFVKP